MDKKGGEDSFSILPASLEKYHPATFHMITRKRQTMQPVLAPMIRS